MWYLVFLCATGVFIIWSNVVNGVWIRRIDLLTNDGCISCQSNALYVEIDISGHLCASLHFLILQE